MKLRRVRQIVLGLLFMALIGEIVILAPKNLGEGEPNRENNTPVAPVNDEVGQTMKGVHLIEARDEDKEWELWADEARGHVDKEVWELDRVKALFFSKDGVVFKVTGNRGTVDVQSKNMKVEGNVVTTSSSGYVFKTQEVVYNSAQKLLSSQTKVRMRGPRDQQGDALRLIGNKMKADLNTSVMEVSHDVRGSKKFKDGKNMKIRSHRSEMNAKSHAAKFLGDVVIDVDSMRITGPEAEFIYDKKQKTVNSLDVSGGVKVSDVDKWASSDQLKVLLDKDQFIFNGRPRLIQNNDELIGEKIVFSNGGKRVRVIGAKAKVEKDRLEELN